MNIILQPLDKHLNLMNSFQDDNVLTFVFKLDTKSAYCPYCGCLSIIPIALMFELFMIFLSVTKRSQW